MGAPSITIYRGDTSRLKNQVPIAERFTAEFHDLERKKIFAAHPEFGSPEAPVDQLPEDVRGQLQAALQKMREDLVPFANAEVQRELRELVSKVAA